MKNFGGKTKLNTVSMMHLIFETGKNEVTSIIDAMNKSECSYNHELAEVNTVALIYELCRFELYKSNDKDKVDNVMTKVYEQFLFVIKVEKREEYTKITDSVIYKMNEIFSQDKLLAPKENFVYRLFLEQLGIKESSIKSIYIQNIAYLAQRWVLLAESIEKSYSIEDSSEDLAQNSSIDYRF